MMTMMMSAKAKMMMMMVTTRATTEKARVITAGTSLTPPTTMTMRRCRTMSGSVSRSKSRLVGRGRLLSTTTSTSSSSSSLPSSSKSISMSITAPSSLQSRFLNFHYRYLGLVQFRAFSSTFVPSPVLLSSRTSPTSYSYPTVIHPIGQIKNHPNHNFHNVDPRRKFSSNIMGYSPMSPGGNVAGGNNNNNTKIPTKDDVTLSGGVWAPTSAKRDKLTELKSSLNVDDGQSSLDDVATPDQKYDLWLADGLKLITRSVDTAAATTSSLPIPVLLDEFTDWLSKLEADKTADGKLDINQTELQALCQVISAKINNLLDGVPVDTCLVDVRDFLDSKHVTGTDGSSSSSSGDATTEEEHAEFSEFVASNDGINTKTNTSFELATLRYRLLLVQGAVRQLEQSWTALTTVSDADIDRAAVKGQPINAQAESISISKVCDFLQSHATGSCHDRVSAAWRLLDRDDDGLLDEKEMNEVSFLCLASEQDALKVLCEETLDASPVRLESAPPDDDTNDGSGQSSAPPAKKKGWRQRRKERKIKKSLNRMFQKCVKNHFQDEVEINHRLRCIYAWANKHDQNNKIESVLVDGSGDGGGRKRYVELSPKISLEEFREVQQVHFQHLDQIGLSIVNSFREDLWVDQGKGRERKELIRDCLLFLAAVSVADFTIMSL